MRYAGIHTKLAYKSDRMKQNKIIYFDGLTVIFLWIMSFYVLL